MEIIYSSKFEREYRKLSKEVKLVAEKKEKIFRKNPSDKILYTHKLHGKLKNYLAFSIDKKYRIIFEYGSDNTIYFHSVGDHSIY